MVNRFFKPCVLLGLLAASSAALAAVWHVSPTGSDDGDGSSASPFATIGRAAEAVGDWDEIHIAGGLYEENVTIDASLNGFATNVFIYGGYDRTDWTRKIATEKTVVKAADATKDVVGIYNCYTLSVSAVSFTGGKIGLYCKAVAMTFDHLSVTNNSSYGLNVLNRGNSTIGYGFAKLTSSLFAHNNYGVCVEYGSAYRVDYSQCSFVSNAVNGVRTADTYGTHMLRNCLFEGNGTSASDYQYQDNNGWFAHIYNCCFGSNPGNRPHVTVNTVIATQYEDPKIDATYHLTAKSKCNKKGLNLSAQTPSVTEDLDGTAFGDTYDIGCYASPYPFPQIGPFDDVYIAENGSDDSESGNTPETALKTFAEAMQRISENGTLHLGEGTFSECPCVVSVNGVTVLGAGIGKTKIVGSSSAAGLDVQAHFVTVTNLTITGGKPGLKVAETSLCTNILVVCCDISGNLSSGILSYGGTVNSLGRYSHLILTNNIERGFTADADNTIYIDNVLAADNGTDGMHIAGARFYVVNCTMADNGTSAFAYGNQWGSSQPAALYNCILSGSPIGYRNTSEIIEMRDGSVYNCLFADNDQQFVLYGRPLANSNNVSFAESAQFTGREPYPYRLKPLSPARGIGTNLTTIAGFPITVTDDLGGVARNPASWDDGCYVVPKPGMLFLVR